jgi:hypothetical protein
MTSPRFSSTTMPFSASVAGSIASITCAASSTLATTCWPPPPMPSQRFRRTPQASRSSRTAANASSRVNAV